MMLWRITDIITDYDRHIPVAELQKKYGLSAWKIYQVLRSNPKHSYNILRDAKIAAERKAGVSLTVLAYKYNLTRQRIHQIVKLGQ